MGDHGAFEAAKAIARTGDFEHVVTMARREDGKNHEVRAATLALLAGRAAGSTLCPSEVARAIAAAAGTADWRGEMPAVHAAVDSMVADGLIHLSWKGEAMPARDGPYRIGRAAPGRRA
jgi:hypothetical protein